ncbi:PTS sugar transporter subunit IIB [Suicoccus acidiformans]|uniref:Ascorbate-specific PTS system EIIA component n=1 Tax=Suicoccus acidiformans TaxID=2036206 RepID=A0A347WIT6_9LACT|nr:PTS sugar transporter subunit IIA [Suicoccus acidiformans]AXY24993.1 PTS sugar transporter subunit IIB [Suicoccus acidiformans]
MIADNMIPELINYELDAKDWEEAIRLAARPLIESNYIKPSYVESMINNVKNDGPYIVITKNVAIPHASPDEGGLKSGISVSTLKKPISFGNEANDPVKYIFVISAVDNNDHLKLISEMVSLLEDELFYSLLDNKSESQIIIDYIKERGGTI